MCAFKSEVKNKKMAAIGNGDIRCCWQEAGLSSGYVPRRDSWELGEEVLSAGHKWQQSELEHWTNQKKKRKKEKKTQQNTKKNQINTDINDLQ